MSKIIDINWNTEEFTYGKKKNKKNNEDFVISSFQDNETFKAHVT
jgi:hypothetical protein